MFRWILLLLLISASSEAKANDTLLIRGHRYFFTSNVSYWNNIILYKVSDTGSVEMLGLTTGLDGRDEFGGSCIQTAYEVSHDTLTLWIHHIEWGEQMQWGWDYTHDLSCKETYVFQSTGKLVLLTRIYSSDDLQVKKEIESKTNGCFGG